MDDKAWNHSSFAKNRDWLLMVWRRSSFRLFGSRQKLSPCYPVNIFLSTEPWPKSALSWKVSPER